MKLLRLCIVLVVAGCPQKPAQNPAPAASTSAPAPAASTSAPAPSIECPLHKKGVDPTHLRPFEKTAEYIAFLERPERALWQKPDEVVASLGLRGTETVVDVGAGSGYFSFRFARALPQGKVIAADPAPEMIRHVHHTAMTRGVRNIEARLIEPDDPGVSPATDVVFVCDVLHHVKDRAAWLGKLATAMKPGARLVVIEFKEGELPQGPPASMKIPRSELIASVTRTGLAVDRQDDKLLPYQYLIVFRKP